ncbi:MAG: hypothetical protein UY92_C0002G0035 [Candidatus Magasanikbacteria bacterium GW2011_GWA2_56_11]|uniref:HicB family protein n=1 Tax=Candidatus Magasanikbacteria bacterium GW2011_GWA2_56_11 TaxID=1619044 RepID=A0A0G1YHK7_9BACT|nr:MAG: hypothetical protein UY92_C0002G0035 [Candidatus Magasanikbacteria bacterium GW2011_GWA2_56_11]
MSNLDLKAAVWKEGKYFVSQCLNVDVSSYGKTKKEALGNLLEALQLYFEGVRKPKLSEVKQPDVVSLKLRHA